MRLRIVLEGGAGRFEEEEEVKVEVRWRMS